MNKNKRRHKISSRHSTILEKAFLCQQFLQAIIDFTFQFCGNFIFCQIIDRPLHRQCPLYRIRMDFLWMFRFFILIFSLFFFLQFIGCLKSIHFLNYFGNKVCLTVSLPICGQKETFFLSWLHCCNHFRSVNEIWYNICVWIRKLNLIRLQHSLINFD